MPDLTPDECNEAALSAVSEFIYKIDNGSMVQRFVLLVDVIDTEGERSMWSFAPPGSKPWDTLGLLAFAMQLEQAYSVDRGDE